MRKHYHHLFAVIVTVIWGLNFVFAKAALAYFAPFTLLVLRYCIVAAILIPFFPKPPISVARLALISFTFAILHIGAMFLSLEIGLNASVGVVVMQMQVPFLLILGVIFFKENVGWRSIMGLLLAIAGSVVLVGTPNSIENLSAFFMMLGSALAVALYSALLKGIKTKVHPVALIAWIALLAIPMLLPLALIFESPSMDVIVNMEVMPFISLLYISLFASIIAHSLWAMLLANHPIQSFAPMTLLVPVIGVFGGVVFLYEALSLYMVLGASMMLCGVGIITLRRPKAVIVEADG